eukprot:COSAG01_NODE_1_length_100484_cov_170.446142_91_plen_201_part_00
MIGKKVGMTQILNDSGGLITTTILKVYPANFINRIQESDRGYSALLISSIDIEEKKCNKPHIGIFKKHKVKLNKILFELRVDDLEPYKELDKFDINSFSDGDIVAVTGKSKGKGFSGTIKKFNFARGPMSHGSKNHRLPGSIGAGTTPSRVLKGTKMAGKMGNANVVNNNRVVKIDPDKSLLFLKGSVSGSNGTYVRIQG